MAENHIAVPSRTAVKVSEIWTSQHPLMHTWLLMSFFGLVILYLAMNISVV